MFILNIIVIVVFLIYFLIYKKEVLLLGILHSLFAIEIFLVIICILNKIYFDSKIPTQLLTIEFIIILFLIFLFQFNKKSLFNIDTIPFYFSNFDLFNNYLWRKIEKKSYFKDKLNENIYIYIKKGFRTEIIVNFYVSNASLEDFISIKDILQNYIDNNFFTSCYFKETSIIVFINTEKVKEVKEILSEMGTLNYGKGSAASLILPVILEYGSLKMHICDNRNFIDRLHKKIYERVINLIYID